MATREYPVAFFVFLRMSGIVLLCLLWEVLPRTGIVNPAFFPPLSAVLEEAVRLLRNQHLFGHTVATLWRVMMGILMAALLAVPAGAVLGHWRPGLAAALNPLFRILAQVNPFSLMTVFLLFFGIGEKAKLIIVTWVAFWPLIQHVTSGVQHMDADLVKTARSMGTSPTRMFFGVLLPGVAPSILLGIRSSIILLLAILVAGEMLGGLAGLGWLLHWSSNYYASPYATTPVFAVGLCISLIGVALSATLRKLERDLFIWRPVYSLWNSAPAFKRSGARPNRLFTLAVLSAALILLLAGGVETSRLSKTNSGFSGEDLPPPVTTEQNSPAPHHGATVQPTPGAGHSGHSGHTR